jgi:hypothetical protein
MTTKKSNAKTTKRSDPIQPAVEGLYRDPAWNERYAAERAATVRAIARAVLGIETLETRSSDRLDFHEVAVWGVRQALEQAYREGHAAGLKAGGDIARKQLRDAR